MKLEKGNFGGSQVSSNLTGSKYADPDSDLVKTALLSDVVDAILKEKGNAEQKLNIVMKMDIEGFECRAVLGSGKRI